VSLDVTSTSVPRLLPPHRGGDGRRGVPGAHRGAVLLLVLAVFGLSGCGAFSEWRRKKTPTVQSVALHVFARGDLQGDNMTRLAATPDGSKRVYIHHLPLLTSRQITHASVEEADASGRLAIRFNLDHHGGVLWLQACRQMPDDPLAVLIDGFYCCSMRVPHGREASNSFVIHGPWSQQEAEAIAGHAAMNYRNLNPSMYR